MEFRIASALETQGVPFEYEERKVWFIAPAKLSHYTPDFILPSGIVIEGKGRFDTDDRQKHKHIKALHPGLDIRFVFSNSKAKINKGSKTSYADWCQRYGYQYADKLIPGGWLQESTLIARWEAIEAAQDKLAISRLMPDD